MDFSETVIFHDIKLVDSVNRMSTWTFMNSKGQGHLLTLVQITHIQYFWTSFPQYITSDFSMSSAVRWAIQDQWSSGYFNLVSTVLFYESMNEAGSFTAFMAWWYKLNPIWCQRWPSHCKKICGFDKWRNYTTVGSNVENPLNVSLQTTLIKT